MMKTGRPIQRPIKASKSEHQRDRDCRQADGQKGGNQRAKDNDQHNQRDRRSDALGAREIFLRHL